MSESPDADKSMYFAKVLSRAIAARLADEGDGMERTGATWLATRLGVPVPTVAEWLTKPRKGWLSKDAIEGIGNLLFKGDAAPVYIANAVSLGFNPPRTGGGAFSTTLPSWVNDLPDEAQTVLRDLIYVLGKAHSLTE